MLVYRIREAYNISMRSYELLKHVRNPHTLRTLA